MSQDDVTGWLVAWGKGDPAANSRLLEAVYKDLRRVARRRLGAERGDHSLTPTALVHEAYVRLVDLRRVRWQNRLALRFEGNEAPAVGDDPQRTALTPIAQTIAGAREQSRKADLQSQGSDQTSETSWSRPG
jgi:hypothetical protein